MHRQRSRRIQSLHPLLLSLLAVLALFASACGNDGADSSAGSDSPAGSDDQSSDTGTEGDEPDTYSGYVVDPPVNVASVTLPVADGSSEMTMVAAEDGLKVVYFGYTFCPDVCPTTMADVRKALAEMPADEADRIGVSMLTIDPARDTAEVLDGYVANFVDDGVALRTENDTQLRAAADAFGANYELTTNAEGDIEVKHTGELYAVDDTGTIVMQWPFGTSYESLARDLRSLLAESEQA